MWLKLSLYLHSNRTPELAVPEVKNLGFILDPSKCFSPHNTFHTNFLFDREKRVKD